MDQAIEGFRVALRGADARRRRPAASARWPSSSDCFDLSEHDVQRNRVLVAEQGLLSGPQRLAARGAGPPGRAGAHARPRVRLGQLPRRTRCSEGAIPKTDPRLLTRAILGLYNSIWHWYRPNGIVALNRIAEFFTDRSLALIGVAARSARAREGRGMSFFERYFAALDGPDPHSSLELVADDVEFAIQWADGERPRQPPARRRPRGAARASSTPAT